MTPEDAQALLLQLAGALPPFREFPPAEIGSIEPPDLAARYRTLVEQIPAVIFMAFLDRGLSEAYVSPHVETVLGFTQEEWLNDPVRWYQQIHPDDRTRWSIEAAQLILSGQAVCSAYRVIARDGRVIWFHCQVKLVLTQDGRPWFLHGVAFDITDLKEAEIALKRSHGELDARVQERTAELERANRNLEREIAERKRAEAGLARTVEELKRSNADLRQFAYSASHDLQEPLRNIANYSEWLTSRYRGKLDPKADQFLSFLTEGAQRMIAMIRDLLDYTRTASEDEETDEVTEPSETLASVTADLRVLIHENQATITFASLPVLAVREVHLRQLFQNLLVNAIKYKGEVSPRVHISGVRSDGYCCLSVADNGRGIARDFHEKVFGIFTRLEQRSESSGTGIGLAICKRIVERYGGKIWVESEPNRGATFFFTLPLAARAS